MKFLKNAKKNSILQEPINKYKKWKKRNPTEEDVENELDATIKVGFLVFLANLLHHFFSSKGAYNNFEKLEVISFYTNVFYFLLVGTLPNLQYRSCLFWTFQNMTSLHFLSIQSKISISWYLTGTSTRSNLPKLVLKRRSFKDSHLPKKIAVTQAQLARSVPSLPRSLFPLNLPNPLRQGHNLT